MCSRDVLEYYWIVDMLGLFRRIIIAIWGIVLRTLRDRYLLLYGRVIVHTMCSRDILELLWIGEVHSLSQRINISIWGIVMHTLRERYLLLDRQTLLTMLGRDVQCGWVSEVHSLS